MDQSTKDMIEMIVRKLVTLGTGAAIGHGLISATDITTAMIDGVVSLVGLVISVLWSRAHQARLKKG